MKNIAYKYCLQSIPNGYRIVFSNGNNYYPIFEIFPPLSREILDKIVLSLEQAYNQGHTDGWRECCNKLGIVIDY